MRLDDARLCLDCEEIHEEQECPACGSEAFAFLTRWIQSTNPERPKARGTGVTERPGLKRSAAGADDGARASDKRPSREYLDAWKHLADGAPDPGRGKSFLTRGLLGLAAAGLAGWAWSRSAPDKTKDRTPGVPPDVG